MSQPQRFLAFVAATLALGGVLVALGPSWLEASAPEGEVLTALKVLERRAPSTPLSFGVLHPRSLQFQRLGVVVAPSGEAAWVTATLDLEGSLERPGQPDRTQVSSLGLERVPFARREGAWAPVTGGWPRLSAALEALERRRQALESARPAGVTRRRYRALAWYLRSEREAVQVAEDFRVDEDGADRPRDESGSRRFALLVAPDGGFDDRE